MQIRIAQLFGFTAVIGHATDGARGGGSMILLCKGEIRMKQTLKGCGIARVSLEWRDREYDIASMYTRDDGSKRLDFLSHLDQRRTKHMDGHNGEWSRDVWATATEVQVGPSKVDGPGGTRRDSGTSPRSRTWLPRRPRCACAH